MRLRHLAELPTGILDTPAAELQQLLGGPTVIDLSGAAAAPPVFISVLLHGNEFSGWMAMQQLLRRAAGNLPRPLVLLLGDVAAAAAQQRRHSPACDFNRIWSAHTQVELGQQLWQLRDSLRARGVCAAVDIHNTNGSNPPHALHMARAGDAAAADFAAGFTGIVLNVQHGLGSCMEAFAPLCPTATIECGLPGDADGIRLAVEFVTAVLHGNAAPPRQQRHYHLAARVSSRAGIRIGFGEAPAEVVLPADADRWNLATVPAGTELARVGGVEGMPLQALAPDGSDIIARYLKRSGDSLVAARDLTPVMFTPDSALVEQDCLCYFLEAGTA